LLDSIPLLSKLLCGVASCVIRPPPLLHCFRPFFFLSCVFATEHVN
jgi:hypothetical protein